MHCSYKALAVTQSLRSRWHRRSFFRAVRRQRARLPNSDARLLHRNACGCTRIARGASNCPVAFAVSGLRSPALRGSRCVRHRPRSVTNSLNSWASPKMSERLSPWHGEVEDTLRLETASCVLVARSFWILFVRTTFDLVSCFKSCHAVVRRPILLCKGDRGGVGSSLGSLRL